MNRAEQWPKQRRSGIRQTPAIRSRAKAQPTGCPALFRLMPERLLAAPSGAPDLQQHVPAASAPSIVKSCAAPGAPGLSSRASARRASAGWRGPFPTGATGPSFDSCGNAPGFGPGSRSFAAREDGKIVGSHLTSYARPNCQSIPPPFPFPQSARTRSQTVRFHVVTIKSYRAALLQLAHSGLASSPPVPPSQDRVIIIDSTLLTTFFLLPT